MPPGVVFFAYFDLMIPEAQVLPDRLQLPVFASANPGEFRNFRVVVAPLLETLRRFEPALQAFGPERRPGIRRKDICVAISLAC